MLMHRKVLSKEIEGGPTSPIDDNEIFYSPPTTPGPSAFAMAATDPDAAGATLTRRVSGRPHTLSISSSTNEWTSDVVLDGAASPDKSSSAVALPQGTNVPTITTIASTPQLTAPVHSASPTRPRAHTDAHTAALKSPCFLHSNLDKGGSLSDWLHKNQQNKEEFSFKKEQRTPNGRMGLIGSTHHHHSPTVDSGNATDAEEDSSSLTRQLAETAVSVREMSKQLGRARVRSNLQSVLIITKARDNRLIKLTRELALYLMLRPKDDGRGLIVYVDNQLRQSKRFDAPGIQHDHPELFLPAPRRRSLSATSPSSSFGSERSFSNGFTPLESAEEGQLRYWTSDMCRRSPHLFDFVITLGGDGTVLFTSWLFQNIVPPVLPFALGSLGFLTNFDFADHQHVMDTVIDSGIRVNLRMRFTCTVFRAVAPEKGKGRRAVKKAETGEIIMKNIEKDGWEALEGGYGGLNASTKDREVMCFTTRPVETFEVLNDLVVDRGPSPYVSLLELFGDEHHMTTVQADGLTVSTPTGSTAYSLSAGGSLVHPEIPALLITPICPHTLSFRPMLLPDTMELRICVPFNSRSTAWASFDGRGRIELKQGDHIKVTASKYPFPTVCADNQSTDWFNSISRTLKWNERERQKSFVVVEEGPAQLKGVKVLTKEVEEAEKDDIGDEEDEEDEEDEPEEDKFDIDDSSPEVAEAAAKAAEAKAAKLAQDQQIQRSPNIPKSPNISKGRPPSRTRPSAGTPDRYHPSSTIPHLRSAGLASSSEESDRHIRGETGDRDDIHNPRGMQGSKSKIPTNRDVETESFLRTPRPQDSLPPAVVDRLHHRVHRRSERRNRSLDLGGRRAFAVWGCDDTDSNASDSDAGR